MSKVTFWLGYVTAFQGKSMQVQFTFFISLSQFYKPHTLKVKNTNNATSKKLKGITKLFPKNYYIKQINNRMQL